MSDESLTLRLATTEYEMLRLVLARLASPLRCEAKTFSGDPFTSECDFVPCGSDACLRRQLDVVRREREDEETG